MPDSATQDSEPSDSTEPEPAIRPQAAAMQDFDLSDFGLSDSDSSGFVTQDSDSQDLEVSPEVLPAPCLPFLRQT